MLLLADYHLIKIVSILIFPQTTLQTDFYTFIYFGLVMLKFVKHGILSIGSICIVIQNHCVCVLSSVGIKSVDIIITIVSRRFQSRSAGANSLERSVITSKKFAIS